jgi:uncharacterized membrane protein
VLFVLPFNASHFTNFHETCSVFWTLGSDECRIFVNITPSVQTTALAELSNTGAKVNKRHMTTLITTCFILQGATIGALPALLAGILWLLSMVNTYKNKLEVHSVTLVKCRQHFH